MTEALSWSELGANGATILAALIAAITIPLAYYQLRKTEEARRLDIVETRIFDAFLALPNDPLVLSGFSGSEYGELSVELGRRRRLARLLVHWRHIAGSDRSDPFLHEVWLKLALDVVGIEKDCHKLLSEQGIDLKAFESRSEEQIWSDHADEAGGFSSVPMFILGARATLQGCSSLKDLLRSFAPIEMAVIEAKYQPA
jgi:hypothetical protein